MDIEGKWRPDKKNLGLFGENVAQRYLESLGHHIIRRNLKSGAKEIDIISFDENGIHFVEVKTRTFPFQARPEECVTRKKQQCMIKFASEFLRSRMCRELIGSSCHECNFDIVSVIVDKRGCPHVEYFPNAFTPIWSLL